MTHRTVERTRLRSLTIVSLKQGEGTVGVVRETASGACPFVCAKQLKDTRAYRGTVRLSRMRWATRANPALIRHGGQGCGRPACRFAWRRTRPRLLPLPSFIHYSVDRPVCSKRMPTPFPPPLAPPRLLLLGGHIPAVPSNISRSFLRRTQGRAGTFRRVCLSRLPRVVSLWPRGCRAVLTAAREGGLFAQDSLKPIIEHPKARAVSRCLRLQRELNCSGSE